MHPKSLFTASVFASTFVLSFLIVAADNFLPCPARARGHMYRADGSHRSPGGDDHRDSTGVRHKKRKALSAANGAPSLIGEALEWKEDRRPL